MSSKCPEGKIRSPTGRCINVGGAAYKKYFGSGKRSPKRRSRRRKSPSPKCGAGRILNPASGRCVSRDGPTGIKILRGRRSPARKSRARRPARSRGRRQKRTNGKYSINEFFNKIFIINLEDKVERWKKVTARFKRNNVKYTQFKAVDGRCKTDAECRKKRALFMKKYKVKMALGEYPLKELLPASSLTIGTILILREMVENRWERVLICEDDIVFGRELHTRFKKGVQELEKYLPDWDVLYLGCGSYCGYRGVSKTKTGKNKYKSTLMKFYPDTGIYVEYRDDLRNPCGDCPRISENLSRPAQPGGTWCYGYSLKGAKKMLKYINNQAGEHIDGLLWQGIIDGKLIAAAFDPPVVWHQSGAFRLDSDIPWAY